MTILTGGAREELSGTIKIIGIGQSLRGDDGAGLAAVRFWQDNFMVNSERAGIQVELEELPGLGLLSLLDGASLAILVDAVRSEAKAGTIHLLSMAQLGSFQAGSGSAHGWGVAETLALAQKVSPSSIPKNMYIIGIEAGDLSLGESLSPEVELALPEVASLIEQLVNSGKSADKILIRLRVFPPGNPTQPGLPEPFGQPPV
jgi:hydrogenase maturation protease